MQTVKCSSKLQESSPDSSDSDSYCRPKKRTGRARSSNHNDGEEEPTSVSRSDQGNVGITNPIFASLIMAEMNILIFYAFFFFLGAAAERERGGQGDGSEGRRKNGDTSAV